MRLLGPAVQMLQLANGCDSEVNQALVDMLVPKTGHEVRCCNLVCCFSWQGRQALWLARASMCAVMSWLLLCNTLTHSITV